MIESFSVTFPKDFGKPTLRKRLKCWVRFSHVPKSKPAGFFRREGGRLLYSCDRCQGKVVYTVFLEDLPIEHHLRHCV